MKTYISLILIVLFTTVAFSQKVERNGKTYTLKNEKILLDGEDVTDTLENEERVAILNSATEIRAKITEEKKAKKLQKEKKKAEKALKQKEKLEKNLSKAQKDLEKANKKYNKLKEKGKLSPVDETKWSEKLQKLQEKID